MSPIAPPEFRRTRPPLPNPLTIKIGEQNTLIIEIPRDFSERSWAARFGQIHQALKNRNWANQPVDHCCVDFVDCYWADPLPLLSLALTLADFEFRGGAVSIVLPEMCQQPRQPDRTRNSDCLEPTRLLKFLAREGFLDLLVRRRPATAPASMLPRNAELRAVSLGINSFAEDDFAVLRNLWPPLAFAESTCVTARLLEVKTPPPNDDAQEVPAILLDIDRWVERALHTQIMPVVVDKVPPWAQRGLLYRLQILLRELLHNAAEHAYESHGLAAVYVRYREGQFGQAPSAWRTLERYISREENSSCGALLRAAPNFMGFARTRAGFFEVFVLDAGRGLVDRIAADPKQAHLRLQVNPLHSAMRLVFSEGYSSKPVRPTEHGGLHLLQRLLEPLKDYIRACDDDTWWGRELPLPTTQSDTTPMGAFVMSCEAKVHENPPVPGLAWTARLSWPNRMDRAESPVGSWQGFSDKRQRQPLIETLREGSPAAVELEGVAVHDWRLSCAVWNNSENLSPASVDVLLTLPDRDWMKDTIQDRLNEVVSAGYIKPGGLLVVGEIASEEALTFLAATRRAKRLFKDLENSVRPSFLILVTRDLRALVLHRSGPHGLFQETPEHTRRFFAQDPTDHDGLSWRVRDYYRFLRLHDGRRIWEAVRWLAPMSFNSATTTQTGKRHDAPYINEWVDWHHGICLDGYLDFPATLTNPTCRQIYSFSLERLAALFPNNDCRLVALDSLVDSLVVDFRAQQRPRGRHTGSPPVDVCVGSVQVSGLTADLHRSDPDRPTTFHFFRHPSGTASGLYLLPWFAKIHRRAPEECNAPDRRPRDFYERIGRTPAIARGGWKAFRMPRFDKSEASIYEASPSETYRAWQDPSRTPLKLGHWSYGGHHDLLTVNLLLAFDTELDQISLAVAGRLGRFIYANLCRAFDIQPKHLSPVGQALLATIAHDGFRHLLPKRIGSDGAIVIFPSHPVTDHVFARLTSWLNDDAKLADILSRCIPILPIKRNRSGSGLQISGPTLERLQSFAGRSDAAPGQADPVPPAVFFDDAMISGRTYLELKSMLYAMGYRDIYSVTMLDRHRLPSASHINVPADDLPAPTDGSPREVRSTSFWRLDAPAMGSPGHCPLCTGLGRARDLAKHIRNRERRERAHHWQELWSERNPATEWGDGGLRPVPLDLKKPTRKFGIVPSEIDRTSYRQAGGDREQIVLTNSAGLVAWVTEMYAVTSRDDLPLSLLKREDFTPETVIQLIASQLLLFQGEFDDALALDLGTELAKALMDAPSHDRNTAFAAITFLACGTRYLSDVVRHLVGICDVSGNGGIPPLRNIDFYVLLDLCELLHIDTKPLVAPRYSADLEPTRISPANTTGVTARPVADKCDDYRRLDLIVSAGEHEHHSSALRRLSSSILKHNGCVTADQDRHLINAKSCATDLKFLIRRFNPLVLRPESSSGLAIKQEFDRQQEDIALRADQLVSEIDMIIAQLKQQPDVAAEVVDCARLAEELLGTVIPVFESIHYPLGLAYLKTGNEPEIVQELKSALKECQRPETIAWVPRSSYFNKQAWRRLNKPDMREVYVVWDSDVLEALDRLLSNVRHAGESPRSCPTDWDPDGLTGSETAHQWVALEIEEKHLCIRLRSYPREKITAAAVEREMEAKWFVAVFREIGGGVKYQVAGEALQTSVKIPYAHTLPKRGHS